MGIIDDQSLTKWINDNLEKLDNNDGEGDEVLEMLLKQYESARTEYQKAIEAPGNANSTETPEEVKEKEKEAKNKMDNAKAQIDFYGKNAINTY